MGKGDLSEIVREHGHAKVRAAIERRLAEPMATRSAHQNGDSTSSTVDPFEKSEEDGKLADVLGSVICVGESLNAVQIPPRQTIIESWFKEGDCGYVFAPRGLGKTWISLGLVVAISTGGKLGPWKSEVSWPVLYVDGEMPFESIRERIHGLNQGRSPELLHVLNHEVLFQKHSKSLNLANLETQEAVTQYCLETGIRVLVLDNLSCLFSGVSENDADDWEVIKQWFLRLRRQRIAVIVVHHTGRNRQHMRGTTRREDDVFWVIRLDEPADSNFTISPGARFISRFTKNRNAPAEPSSYEWTFSPGATGETSVQYSETSSDETILQWVRDGLDSATEIAKEMGVSTGTISKRAARLIEAGRLLKKGRNYALREDQK
jgi:DNA-binding NarL/FixJ family response regulator